MEAKIDKREQCIIEINEEAQSVRRKTEAIKDDYKAGEHSLKMNIKEYELTNMICARYKLDPVLISKIRQFDYLEVKEIVISKIK